VAQAATGNPHRSTLDQNWLHRSGVKLKLIFYSCASVFDVTPLAMGQGSHRSGNPGATPMPEIP
jgi:hypothetical protein